MLEPVDPHDLNTCTQLKIDTPLRARYFPVGGGGGGGGDSGTQEGGKGVHTLVIKILKYP